MSDQRVQLAAPIEPYFDRTPRLFGDGLQEPLVYDASPRMLRRQRLTVAGQQRDGPSNRSARAEPPHCDGNRGLGIAAVTPKTVS